MEFVEESEVMGLLRQHGIVPSPPKDEGPVHLQMADGAGVVRLHLAASGSAATPDDRAEVMNMEADRLPAAIDDIMGKLRLTQLLLIPVSPWRHVFDAVAFSLAENEDWQEIDTQATVELNTRDPLLCEPGDFQTVSALIRALLNDAESPEQGLMLTTTEAPLLVEVIPEGAVRVTLGNQVMADEIAEALAT